MNRCTVCVMPATRPDVPFVDGICQACRNYQARPEIDWDARKFQLLELLERHHGRCIVPSSGGKDSTYQVMTLLELGASVTVVTAATCYLTEIGRRNIDNLSRHARTIEVAPNRTVRAKLNKLGQELVGDISWPEHVAIFTIPFQVASDTGQTLMFYGENPQNQYGGPHGTEAAHQLTQRWRSEFGGFLGLRPNDLIGMEGIRAVDMDDYRWPPRDAALPEAHFLGQYIPWDSHQNAAVAIKAGMQYQKPTRANWWEWENLDGAAVLLHDYFGFLKYGYGRGCAQISVDVRYGRIDRAAALEWVRTNDGILSMDYAGVSLDDLLARMQVGRDWLEQQVRQWVNADLFDLDGPLPRLKDFQ